MDHVPRAVVFCGNFLIVLVFVKTAQEIVGGADVILSIFQIIEDIGEKH